MKQLEGLVYYPFPMPAKRMVNGKPVDSESDEEEKTETDHANQVLEQPKPEKKIALVIDTNVLLKQTQIRELLKVPDLATFESQFEVVTLDSVIGEIRDERSREYINNGLPFSLDVKKAKTFVERADMVQVKNFALDTGDFTSLSEVDMQVIALGVSLARRKEEQHLVKSEPKPLTEFRPKNFDTAYQQKYDALKSDDSDDEDDSSDSEDDAQAKSRRKAAVDSDDEWNNVAEDRQTKRTNQRKKEKHDHWLKKQAERAAKKEKLVIEMVEEEQAEDDDDKIDDEQTGGEWITEDNLHKHLTQGDIVPIAPAESTEAESPRENVGAAQLEAQEVTKQEEEAVENPDFPAFDEAQLPSMAELEAKSAQIQQTENNEEGPAMQSAEPESDTPIMITTTAQTPATQQQSQAQAQPAKKAHPIQITEGSPPHVIFLTSDMAMQNVIMHMGFTLLTLDGYRLTRVKRFKLLCRACMKLNMEIDREYCDFCGSHLLGKVPVWINNDGELTYFDNPRRRINLRGTVYSIAKPKGGRQMKDIILREDQLMVGEMAMRVKNLERAKRKEEAAMQNTMSGNYWAGGQGYGAGVSSLLYEDGAKGGAKRQTHANFAYGHGRKNPNIAKRKRK